MNTHINKKKDPKRQRREYLGVTVTSSNYREILKQGGRESVNFHTKHLKAYLKGNKNFTHGWEVDEDGNRLRKLIHQVQERLWIE